MSVKSVLKQLAETAHLAEAELDAAATRTALNAAAKKLMRAKEALKTAQETAVIHAGESADAS